MNIMKKARAGFSSITIRGGRITKWKGQAGSYAPHVGVAMHAASASALALGVALAGGAFAPAAAWAGTCDETAPGSGEFVCAGPTGADVTQSPAAPVGSPIVVTTEPGFALDVAAGNALEVIANAGNTGISVTDPNSATITGLVNGIFARNDGTGNLGLLVTGSVTGVTDSGIRASGGGFGTDVIIAAADTTGQQFGIIATNLGVGALSISSSGTATGPSAYGIYGSLGAYGTDLTITAVDTIGASGGINALNRGSGELSITSTGTATSSGPYSWGIQGSNNGTNLTIDAADATGNYAGIQANNFGTGALSVTSSGTAIGTDRNGIQAINSSYGTDLGIVANNSAGVLAGLDARNYGSGALIVTSQGSASATDGDGIFALNLGTSLIIEATDVTGDDNGVFANNIGTGALSVTASGTITGASAAGVYARNAGTDLTINANDVAGETSGILARNSGSGALTIIAAGTATGVVSEGIFADNSSGTDLTIEAADTTGGAAAIGAFNFGSGALTISSTGTATATSANSSGIYATNYGTDLTINAADSSGDYVGIYATNEGTGALVITSTGTASAAAANSKGIFAVNEGTDLTIGANDSSGTEFGIRARNNGSGALSITSMGTANGGDAAIYARNAGSDLTIAANNTAGGTNAISADNRGTGGLLIVSAGIASATYGTGITASNRIGTTNLAIEAADTTAGSTAISASNQGTGALSITSTGSASSTGAYSRAIYGRNEGTDLIITAANTTGAYGGIQGLNYGSGALVITSTGTATATSPYWDAIYARNSGTDLTIDAADSISARSGINADNSGSGSLAITSTGTAFGTSEAGIRAISSANGTSLTIAANNSTGGDFGIRAENNGTSALAITSSGTATGTGRYSTGIFARNSGSDLTIVAGETYAGYIGISARNDGSGALSITATGPTTGLDLNGIVAINAGTDLAIAATDTSGARTGIIATNNGTGALNITSSGNASGGIYDGIAAVNSAAGTSLMVAAEDAYGARFGITARNNGSGALAITSSGAITGTAGNGIDAFNGGTSLAITANGAVSGGVHGINARNEGTAGLTITANGTVTGAAGAAINAFNSANDVTASMLIEQAAGANFTGATDGIIADNAGGSLTVNALGTLTGMAGSGVNAINQATATSIALTVNNAAGAVSGIAANNQGSGVASVTLLGTAQGGSGAAIDTASAAGNLTTINLAAGAQALAGASGVAIANNAGDSVLNVAAGARMTGEVRLGAGSDAAILNGAGVLAGIAVLDGGADTDALTLNGVVADVPSGRIINWENISFAAGANITAAGLQTNTLTISGSSAQLVDLVAGSITTSDAQLELGGATTLASIAACGGAVTIGGATAIGAGGILGCAAADSITLEGDASVAGNIEGAGGSDVIAVLGNASVAGIIRSGGAGSDGSAASDGTNTITINTSGTIGAIEGSIGRDVMMLEGGTVTGAVLGGAGNDTITLAGATIAGALDGGAGDDVFTLASGSASEVLGGAGNDVVNWNAATATTAAIRLGEGADTLNINDAAINLAGVVLDGGAGADTLNLNDAWSGDLAGANTANWDVINVNGGAIRISDNAITAGLIGLNMGGRLDGSSNLALTGSLALGEGAALLASSASGTNAMTISGSVTNAGMIDLRGQASTAAVGDRLMIDGDYTGLAGSSLVLGAVLGSSGASDQVVVRGDLRGTSSLVVTNLGGTGGLTTGDGIRIVQVDGNSAAGALTLAGGAIDVGAFSYGLQNGGIANPGDQDWYLRSRTRDIAVATLSIARLAQDMSLAALGTLNQRTGEQSHAALQGGSSGFLKGMWGRALGKDYSDTAQSATLGDTSTEGRLGGLQMGADLYRAVASNGARTSIGLFGGHVWSATSDVSFAGFARSAGTTNSEGWSLGGYVTHVAPSGWYVDATILRDWLDHRANGADGTAAFTQSRTLLASLEMGKAFGSQWKFEPQAQFIYGNTRIDDFSDSRGVANRIDADDSFIGRGGFRIKRTWDYDQNSDGGLFTIYAKANIWGRLDGGTSTLAIGGSLPALAQFREVWGDVGIGTTFSLARNAEFFSEFDVEYRIDQGGTALAGRGGFRLRF